MPKPTPDQQRSLAKVTKTKAEVEAELAGLKAHFEKLEQQARVEARLKLDLAVRDAFDDGNKKEWIKQAYGTRDFNTIQKILDRTPSTRAVQAEAEIQSAYSLDEFGYLVVNYVDHGPENANGTGRFEVIDLGEGEQPLMSYVDIDKDGGDAVRFLDGRDEGFYFEEAMAWLEANK